MTMQPPSAAADIRALICAELGRAVSEPGHGWRTPVLASCSEQGEPQARTVVLRGVNEDASELLFFTDRRSPKVREFSINPRATLVFWCNRRRWQLRLRGPISIQTEGPAIRTAWSAIRGSAAAGDYLSAEPPGAALTDKRSLPDVQHQLAILSFSVEVMDWLELSSAGHRRAAMQSDHFQWLTP